MAGTTLETITEEDLDWLTRVQNRLARMQKRETANKNILTREMGATIKSVHELRQFLQVRFHKDVDENL